MKNDQKLNSIAGNSKPVWLTTPDEFASQEVGQWVVIPCDRSDAWLAQGARKQVTTAMAMAWHRTHIETAFELDFPVAVASIQFHKLPLPKDYIREGDVFIKPKRVLRKRKIKK